MRAVGGDDEVSVDATEGRQCMGARQRGIWTLAGAFVVVLALVGTLALAGGGGSSGGGLTTGDPVQLRAASANSGVFTDAYFEALAAPASAAEFKDGIGRLLTFRVAVQQAAIQQCLKQAGDNETLPAARGLDGAQVAYFEDPATLRTNAFGVAAGAKSGAPVNHGAPSSAEAACMSKSVPDADALYALYGQVCGAWMTRVEQMEHSGALDAAWAAFAQCMRQHGYNTPNQDAVASLVNSAAMSSSSKDEVAAVETPVANADADCLEAGVVPQRTQLREVARGAFLEEQRQAFDTIRSQLPGLVADLSAKYSISY